VTLRRAISLACPVLFSEVKMGKRWLLTMAGALIVLPVPWFARLG